MNDPLEMFALKGRVALVTGASGGIGCHAAEVLAAAGAEVILVARRKQRLDEAVARIRTRDGRAHAIEADVGTIEGVRALVAEVAALGLAPDILINNAGIIDRDHFEDVKPENWDKVFALNVTAPMFLAQAFAPHMRAQGWGRIVNIASINALQGKPDAHSYVASKHAVAGMTRSMAAELGRDGVCVNAICPGYIRTEINQVLQNDPAFSAKVETRVPLGRWGQPSDLSGPLLLLSSQAGGFVNGHLMIADGGMTAVH